MSRREAIQMTTAEVSAFLDEQRVVVVASNGRDGWPHLMPLWFVVRGDTLWSWTYAKSQKVRNFERDDRVTLQIEDGEAYDELRGVMFRARAILHRDLDTVAGIGAELAVRYGGAALDERTEAAMRAQAAKRVGVEFEVVETATWDHRKLGGVY